MSNTMISNTYSCVKNSFLACIDEFARTNKTSLGKIYKTQILRPPPIGCKCNTNAFKTEATGSSTINYVFRDSTSQIFFKIGKRIKDNHIFVMEAFAMQEAMVAIIRKQLAEVIIVSVSLVAIKANGENISPSRIRNLVEDIKILAQVVKDIKFVYWIGWPTV